MQPLETDSDLHRRLVADRARQQAALSLPPLRTRIPDPALVKEPRRCPDCGDANRAARRRCKATGGACGGTGYVYSWRRP